MSQISLRSFGSGFVELPPARTSFVKRFVKTCPWRHDVVSEGAARWQRKLLITSGRLGLRTVTETSPTVFAHSSFAGCIGVAREDITPPAGIYARNWGASQYDLAEG